MFSFQISNVQPQAPQPPMERVSPALSAHQRVEVLMETVQLDSESAVSSQPQHVAHQSPQIQLTSEIQTTPAPTQQLVLGHALTLLIKCLMTCVN